MEPNAYAGTVISGSGSTYTVDLIGVDDPASVTVTVLGLDSSETLEAGFGLIIVKIGSSYYSAVPMWVE